MRMADGVIYLVEPVFGYRSLAGQAVIGPTWVEYTFTSEQLPASMGRQGSAGADLPIGHRVLIPLTNVIVIAIADEVDEHDGETLRGYPAADRSAAEQGTSLLCVQWQQKGEIGMIARIYPDHMNTQERRARWQS